MAFLLWSTSFRALLAGLARQLSKMLPLLHQMNWKSSSLKEQPTAIKSRMTFGLKIWQPWPRGAMVARLTPDQKAVCSNHTGVRMCHLCEVGISWATVFALPLCTPQPWWRAVKEPWQRGLSLLGLCWEVSALLQPSLLLCLQRRQD